MHWEIMWKLSQLPIWIPSAFSHMSIIFLRIIYFANLNANIDAVNFYETSHLPTCYSSTFDFSMQKKQFVEIGDKDGRRALFSSNLSVQLLAHIYIYKPSSAQSLNACSLYHFTFSEKSTRTHRRKVGDH